MKWWYWILMLKGWTSTLAADRVSQLPRAVLLGPATAAESQWNAELLGAALERPDQHTRPGLSPSPARRGHGRVPPAGAPLHHSAEPHEHQSGIFNQSGTFNNNH